MQEKNSEIIGYIVNQNDSHNIDTLLVYDLEKNKLEYVEKRKINYLILDNVKYIVKKEKIIDNYIQSENKKSNLKNKNKNEDQ